MVKYLYSINGIKVISLLLIFLYHTGILGYRIDFGARCCEILFVCSGFLVGNKYLQSKMENTWCQSFSYCKKKLIQFYPLHALTLLLVIVYSDDSCYSFYYCFKFINNALLIHSWYDCPEIYFSFNGVSWFLSALLFCYFLSPLLINFVKQINFIGAILVFILCFFFRYSIEYVSVYEEKILNLSVHCNPVIRAAEFFLGILCAKFMNYARDYFVPKNSGNVFLFSLLEIAMIGMCIYFCFFQNYIWLRADFVLLFCFVVLIFSFDLGIISKFFSLSFWKILGAIQFEFYIIHQLVIMHFYSFFDSQFSSQYFSALSVLLLVILISFIYKIIFRRISNYIESRNFSV